MPPNNDEHLEQITVELIGIYILPRSSPSFPYGWSRVITKGGFTQVSDTQKPSKWGYLIGQEHNVRTQGVYKNIQVLGI